MVNWGQVQSGRLKALIVNGFESRLSNRKSKKQSALKNFWRQKNRILQIKHLKKIKKQFCHVMRGKERNYGRPPCVSNWDSQSLWTKSKSRSTRSLDRQIRKNLASRAHNEAHYEAHYDWLYKEGTTISLIVLEIIQSMLKAEQENGSPLLRPTAPPLTPLTQASKMRNINSRISGV